MKVIFNIDDFGYSFGEIEGAVYAYQNGIVSSTTALMTVRDELIEEAKRQSDLNPGFGIGCHLCLTYGRPLTECKCCVDEEGKFVKEAKFDHEHMDEETIYQEYKAQVEKFIKVYGRKPTHIDHHHNIQLYNPILYKAYRRIAEEYQLPYRDIPKNNAPIAYYGTEYYDLNMDVCKKYIDKNSDATIELACHAALVDKELFENTSWDAMRISELRFTTSQAAKDFVKENNVEIVTF